MVAGMPLLDVRVSVSRFGDDSYVVAVGGELDMHTITPFREKLTEVLDCGGRNVLVDLTGVSFLESTTLALLVDIARQLRSAGGQLVLVADDRRVVRPLQLTGLDRVLDVQSSLPEGVQELVDGRRL
jgi:anti-sigma B factor antagonist